MNKRIEKAFVTGRQAFIDGVALEDNPYKREAYRQAWEDGWKCVAEEQSTPVHHTVEVTTQATPTVHVRHAEPTTLPISHYSRATSFRGMACPECGAKWGQKEGTEHRSALHLYRSDRIVAHVRCRVCDYRAKLPVRNP